MITDWSTSPLTTSRISLGRQIVARTDIRCGRQIVAAGEHRRPRPEPLLKRGAQVVRPLHARPQRPVPVVGVAVAHGEQLEPLGQTVADLLRRQRPDPGRGQLDGQRDSVQIPAQRDDSSCVVHGQLEVRACRPGTVHEQVNCLVVDDRLRRHHSRLLRQAQRRHHDHVLAAQPQRPPAGQQEPDKFGQTVRSPCTRSPTADSRCSQLSSTSKRRALGEVVGQRVDLPRPVAALQTQRLRNRRSRSSGFRDLGQRHHPTPVPKAAP